MSEEKTDNILDCVDEEVQEIDPREDPSKKNDKPTLDETVQKLIGKAGNHMESTLIGMQDEYLWFTNLMFSFYSCLCRISNGIFDH